MKIFKASRRDISSMIKMYHILNKEHVENGIDIINNMRVDFGIKEDAYEEDIFEEVLKSEYHNIYLLQMNKEVKGLLNIFMDKEYKCGYIMGIIVDGTRQGIGSELINFASKLTLRAGYNRLQLNVYKFNNAKEFYDKLGFKVIEEYIESEIMEKII